MTAVKWLPVLLVIATALAPLASVPVARADDVATIDADHALATSEAIDRFESEGVATATKTTPTVRLTVAKSHDDVGLAGVYLDADSTYLRIQYNESIPRTLRVYIPAEYWYPVTFDGRQATNTDVSADMHPTPEGRYTVVTVRVTGQTDAVFDIPRAASLVWWSRAKSRDAVESTTGYEPPRIRDPSKPWRYVPEGQLSNGSYPINASDGAVIQYDADPAPGEETWLAVPECDGDAQSVCYYQKRGESDRLYLLSKQSDPPTVRFKTGEDYSARGVSVVEELRRIPERIMADVSRLLGGARSGGSG